MISRKQNGMNMVGQGGKITLFALPALIAALQIHMNLPQLAALPESVGFVRPVGYVLLLVGITLWGLARIQLMAGFAKGQLVTTGVYAIVRNPIYASLTWLVLPAISLITLTWVYFVVAAFLYVGVMIFIGKEEQQLTQVFGKAYEEYVARVDRMIPRKKP